MTDKPERKDAKKDAKEPRSIIHLGMMGDGTEEQTSWSAVILRSASRKTRLMRLSTSHPKEETLTSEFDDGVGNRFGWGKSRFSGEAGEGLLLAYRHEEGPSRIG